MAEFIGISEERMNHMLAVARKCYQISKNMGKDEHTARKAFVVGFLHDIGFEFSLNKDDHNNIGAMMIGSFNSDPKTIEAICSHGVPDADRSSNIYLRILDAADMSIDASGNEVTYEERLEGLKADVGEESSDYKVAVEIIRQLKEIKENEYT